jgi:hypothetical protein
MSATTDKLEELAAEAVAATQQALRAEMDAGTRATATALLAVAQELGGLREHVSELVRAVDAVGR